MIQNIPQVKLGLVTVSRGGFVLSISQRRMERLAEACSKRSNTVYQCPIIVRTEEEAVAAAENVREAGCNALCILLGNFGPESAETILAQHFDGPVMYCAAAEESTAVLQYERGDAYCGLLNCSYNLGLRGVKAYIPEHPVGDEEELAEEMAQFKKIACAVLGVSGLKIITFGPRPQDFLACNAPIKPLFELGVEIEENSELDLLQAYHAHDNDDRIKDVMEQMRAEISIPKKMEDILPKLAQYELTLLDWAQEHKGSRRYVAFANKCWPAFQPAFGFTPCYVNGRLTAKGIPVSCEVDVYGALSEYIGQCLSEEPVTLLDINNTVPRDLYEEYIQGYALRETFMGFHCGNAAACLLKHPILKEHTILKRSLEPDREEADITRGTIEGDFRAGPVTLFRLQGTAESEMKAYIAHGEVLDVPTHSFGSIGIIAIAGMERFYRHVLVQKRFPHHAAVTFGHDGNVLFEVFKLFGIGDVSFNQPKTMPYSTENPFI